MDDSGFGFFVMLVIVFLGTFIITFNSCRGVDEAQHERCVERCESLGGVELVYVNGDCLCGDGVEVEGREDE